MAIATLMVSSKRAHAWLPVAAATIGNALEWFDFVIYGFFAVTIAKLFFPTGDETLSLLVALATFGVTFFVRPFGAIVLGGFSDIYGRKAALTLTISLMMVGTGIIAVTPTYSEIGLFAPALIVVARLIQGFSAGGEFGSATAFLAEQNPKSRGWFASWQFASQGLTTILATSFGVTLGLLTAEQLESWGWRVPFFFGLLIGPVAYYIRRHVDETPEFQALQVSRNPLRETIVGGKQSLLVALGIVVLCTVAMYTILFMPIYATRQLGLPVSGSFLGSLLTGVIQVILIPIFGLLSDRNGRVPIMLVSAIAILLAIYPLFYWLASSPTIQTLLIVQAIMGVLISGYMGALPALMSELFPPQIRTTGLSISYSFAVAIFGGFAPFINTWLIELTGSKLAPSFYLMLATAISITALMMVRRLGVR